MDQWPTSGDELYDRLLEVLDERIASEPDEQRRSVMQRARCALAHVPSNVLAGVLVEVMKYGAGLAY